MAMKKSTQVDRWKIYKIQDHGNENDTHWTHVNQEIIAIKIYIVDICPSIYKEKNYN